MKNLTIAIKIWIVLGAAWIMGVGTSAFLLYRQAAVFSALDNVISHQLVQRKEISRIQVLLRQQVQEWKDVLLRGADPEMFRKHGQAFHEKEAEVKSAGDALLGAVTDPEVKSALAEFRAGHDGMSAKYAEGLRIFTASGGKDVHEADAAVKGVDRPPSAALASASQLLTTRSDTLLNNQRSDIQRERRLIIIALVLCFGAVGVLAGLTTHGLNLRLRHAATELSHGADQVASASAQVSSASQALAQSTSEQAASLEETSASSQEMSSMTSRNAAIHGNRRNSWPWSTSAWPTRTKPWAKWSHP